MFYKEEKRYTPLWNVSFNNAVERKNSQNMPFERLCQHYLIHHIHVRCFMKKIHFLGQKNIISQQLKLCRVKNNLTQGELASQMQTMGVNMDQQMISKIESNSRFVTDYELVCFCKILQVDVSEMLQAFLDG